MKNHELLRPLLLQDLLNTEIPGEFSDFKKWISSGGYVVTDIPSATHVCIDVNNEYAFHHMVAFDSSRMAAASFESMFNIQTAGGLPKSVGWIAVKAYYAAFFAAHSIMRCFGYMCSQLERGHVAQLNEYGQAVGLPGTVRADAGFFSGVYDENTRSLVLKKMKNTHEDTWATLVTCLKEISQDVLVVAGLSAKKQQLSADIDGLIDRLSDHGRLPKGNYLSQFRNAVNYRQEHNLWHPYGKGSIKAAKVASLLSTWNESAEVSSSVWKESADSYNFFLACRDLVNLNYLLVMLIVKNSHGPTLFDRWPNKLLKVVA